MEYPTEMNCVYRGINGDICLSWYRVEDNKILAHLLTNNEECKQFQQYLGWSMPVRLFDEAPFFNERYRLIKLLKHDDQLEKFFTSP